MGRQPYLQTSKSEIPGKPTHLDIALFLSLLTEICKFDLPAPVRLWNTRHLYESVVAITAFLSSIIATHNPINKLINSNS